MERRSSRRFYRPELDVVRFLAFVFVFLSHAIPASSTASFAGAAVRSCSLGLPLFFMLSAYLITRLLLIEQERTGSVALTLFYKRRALRIWPLYALMLGVSAAVSALHHTLHITALWYLAAVFMLANTVWFVRTTVVHLWSISIEEQFYLFWPLAVQKLSTRTLAFVSGAVIALANLTLITLGSVQTNRDGRLWFNTFVEMGFFAAGTASALFVERHGEIIIPQWTRPFVFTAALLCWFSAVRYCHAFVNPGELSSGPLGLGFGHGLAALGCVLIFVALSGLKRLPRVAIYLGRISYGLYVFHAFGLSMSERALSHYGRPITIFAGFLLTVSMAALSYKFFESYFLRLKENLEVIQSRPMSY